MIGPSLARKKAPPHRNWRPQYAGNNNEERRWLWREVIGFIHMVLDFLRMHKADAYGDIHMTMTYKGLANRISFPAFIPAVTSWLLFFSPSSPPSHHGYINNNSGGRKSNLPN